MKKEYSVTQDDKDEVLDRRRQQSQPPDGGWGWLIVLSAFVINVITDGCSYSFGVLFVFLLEYFNETRSSTAWIGSIFCAVPLLCGPIASLVTKKLGLRKATIIGGLITSVGFISSAFVDSVGALAVTYGFIAGIGISMPYLNSIVVVAMYFKKKRALATGLAECGAGIGTLIFAPLYELLIVSYGWRGAILIIGAISLNIIVCGAVFKPVHESENVASATISGSTDTFVKSNSSDRISFAETHASSSEDFHSRNRVRSSKGSLVEELFLDESIALAFPAERDSPGNNEIDHCLKPSVKIRKGLRQAKDEISPFLNKAFLIFTLSSIILYFWYDVPYVFTVDRARENGITEKFAAIMVAVIGISHTFGNVLFGFLGDRKKINRRYLYGFSLLLTGVVLNLVPMFTAFIPSTILAGLFGVLSASAEALTSVIVVDIMGIDKLTDAYGIVMFLQGIANLVGPPVAGW